CHVAAVLRSAGVDRESLVAICFDRSLAMLAAILGVWKAGGAYLPLDPAHPPARLAALLEDARPTLVLTQRHLLEYLPDSDCPAVPFEEIVRAGSPPEAAAGTGPDSHTPDRLAHLPFTPGSPPNPKRRAGPHRRAVH